MKKSNIWIAIRVVGVRGGHPFWKTYTTRKGACKGISKVVYDYAWSPKYKFEVLIGQGKYTEYSVDELMDLSRELWEEDRNDNL